MKLRAKVIGLRGARAVLFALAYTSTCNAASPPQATTEAGAEKGFKRLTRCGATWPRERASSSASAKPAVLEGKQGCATGSMNHESSRLLS